MNPLELPSREQKVFWYLGIDGGLAEGGQGQTDLGTAIEFVALSNDYAPAGIGGECIFTDLRIAIFRDNSADVILEVTPLVDGEAYATIDLTLPGVSSPARSIHELALVHVWPSESNPLTSQALRGTWFQLELRTLADPESVDIYSGRVVIEGIELEWDPVLEGRKADNATP